jgi:hypothetical protein
MNVKTCQDSDEFNLISGVCVVIDCTVMINRMELFREGMGRFMLWVCSKRSQNLSIHQQCIRV